MISARLKVAKAIKPFDAATLQSIVRGGTFKEYKRKQIIFAQGAPADDVFHLQKGAG
jgi:hypothetical protein